MGRILPRLVCLVLALIAVPGRAEAGVSAPWQELGGSASGAGVSQVSSPFGVAGGSVAVRADGRPVVAYTEYPDTAAVQGAIVVKQWTGSAWYALGGPSGIGHGYDPQVQIAPGGAVHVAWLTDDGSGNAEIRLRTWNGVAFVELGGSDSPGGISGRNAGITAPFSLAVGAGGHPIVAFLGLADTAIPDGTATPALVDATVQVYVRQWTGSSWEFVGSGFDGGGASNARSFTSPLGSILHDVDAPSLVVDGHGAPVVAFTYLTTIAGVTADSSDVYVTRWNGSAWVAVGPAVPDGDGDAGRGGAGGVSASAGGSSSPSLAADATGMLVLAWEEQAASGGVAVWARAWDGTSWSPLAGSATGSGVSPVGTVNRQPRVRIDPAGRPIVTWAALTGSGNPTQIFVRRWNGATAWEDMGLDSARGPGISDAAHDALAPALALAPAGAPTIAWLDVKDNGAGQLFLRHFSPQAASPLAVSVHTLALAVATPAGTSGHGNVGSIAGPAGTCLFGGSAACASDVVRDTQVVLQATPEPGNRFLGWSSGPCNGRTSATCSFTLTSNVSTTARFRAVTGVRVLKAGNGAGKVSGAGISCGTDCFQEVFTGTGVTLRPTPAPGSRFEGWSGDACDGQATGACAVATSGHMNRSVTASFQLTRHALAVTVNATGAATGFVVSSPAGIDCGAPGHTQCALDYDYGTAVTLTPAPGEDSMLASWTGCTSRNGPACTVLLKANRTVTARFVEARTLQVQASGNGTGRIVSTTAPGLTCASNCSVSQRYAVGTRVVLKPQPAKGTSFLWTGGDACSGAGSCTALMSQNRTAIGQFTLNRHSLAVAHRASGSVVSLSPLPGGAIDCGNAGTSCAGVFDYGTPVSLQATANAGFAFVRWTGVTCAGGATSALCTFPLRGNVTVTPTYRARTFLTVVKNGTGAGTVSGPGIRCGADCAEAAFDAWTVTLRATPTVGSSFLGFGGACASSTPVCAFVPAGNGQTVTATFELQQRRLTVMVVGQGSVDGPGMACGAGSTPCALDVDYGTSLPLTATAASGHRFTGWSQSCAGTAACTTLLTADRSLTATFEPEFALAVTKPGNSTGTITGPGITCDPDCSETYLGGTKVTLKRSAPSVSTTFRWGGDCAFRETSATCALTLNANVSVSADYSLKQLGLTVIKTGAALGTVGGLGGGIGCGSDCAALVDYGTPVTLVATPSSNPAAEFVSWAGCPTGSTNAACAFTMTANTTVTATFRPLVSSVTLQALSTNTLAVGGIRQLSAVAAFTDGSQEDVTTQATWTSSTPAVATVGATGLVTGRGAGNSSITATFRGLAGDLVVPVDSLAAPTPSTPSITVSCRPYGDTSVLASELACLPSGLSFSVLCQATGNFTSGGTQDITDQVTWVSSKPSVAQATGLVGFSGPVRQSFRIVGNGMAILRATQSGKTSSTTGSLGQDAWVVQGVASTVESLQVTPASAPVAIGEALQLQAIASLSSPTAGCESPPTRDVSAVVTWQSSDETRADVTFFGRVTGAAPGGVTVTATYSGGEAPLSDAASITIVP